MKSLTVFVAAISFLVGGGAFAFDLPLVVDSDFHTGYIPNGFDTNDHIQVVAEGTFSNSCYRPSHVDVEIDERNKMVYVSSKAYVYDGLCLQVIVPYHQEVDLGILKAGDYKVIQQNDATEMGALNVKLATNSDPDDFLYAPVSQAYFDGKSEVRISGEFSNSCMQLVDVMIRKQPNVIVVQPISELEDRENCKKGKYPFEKTVEVKGLEKGKRYLLHIRSLNGKAINNLVDVL